MCDRCDQVDESDPAQVRRWLERQAAWLSDKVARVGWAIQAVEVSADAPPFAYTIGLWNLGHPEIVVFGLDFGCSVHLLDALARGVANGGSRLRDGDEVAADGLPVRLFGVRNPGDIVFRANQFFAMAPDESVPVLQAIYPDDSGVWPWEPGCRLPRGGQPMPGTFVA